MYAAHVLIKDEKIIEQSCKEHSYNVANYSRNYLNSIGLGTTGYLAGLLHDMGKEKAAFDAYIYSSATDDAVHRGSVDHSSAGCIYMLEKFPCEDDWYRAVAEILASVIASHHGIQDCLDDEGKSLFEKRLIKKEAVSYDESLRNFYNEVAGEDELKKLFGLSVDEIKNVTGKIKTVDKDEINFQVGLLARIIQSALVDADRTDAMEFEQQREYTYKYTLESEVERKLFWKRQLNSFKDKYHKMELNCDKSFINEVRSNISLQCETKNISSKGIYRLNVPTGGGKTLAGLRFALNHAYQFNKRRIIFVIPLLSVLEQNSNIIKDYICDKDAIIEHHSNVVTEVQTSDDMDEVKQHSLKLLIEKWEAPMIITTLVQLLNTLFSGKMSAVRRMHALCDSVIIIDEVQSIPRKILSMFNTAMNFLSEVCNCCIVLSSATQPELACTMHPVYFSDNADIVKLTSEQKAVFARTYLINNITSHGMTIDELADFTLSVINRNKSTLVVCNTRRSSLNLWKEIELRKDDSIELFYLSASMCQQHRTEILNKLEKALKSKNDKKVICISTQVIEAGIDISFENVIRVVAGMDNIVQAAGRCNRNGEFGESRAVYVVKLKKDEENLEYLREIKEAQDATEYLICKYKENPVKFSNNLLSDEAIREYYRKLYDSCSGNSQIQNYKCPSSMRDEDTLFNLLSTNSKRLQININRDDMYHNMVLNQSFKAAGTVFNVFGTDTTDVIVPYNEEANKIICDLYSEKVKRDYLFGRQCIEEAKKYVIHILGNEKEKLINNGMLHCYDDCIYTLDSQCYNSEWGFDIEGNTIF